MKEAFIHDLLSMIKKDDIHTISKSVMDFVMKKITPYMYLIVFILVITIFTNCLNCILLILLFRKISRYNKYHHQNMNNHPL